MAHGRKRIVGGITLVVVGVAIWFVIGASRIHWVSVPFERMALQIALGKVGVSFYDKGSYGQELGKARYFWGPKRLVWWLHNPDFDVNLGLVSGHVFRKGAPGTQVVVEFLLWPPMLLALVLGAVSWRRGFVARRRWKNAHKACPACGYARAGLAETAPCPECGRAADLRSASPVSGAGTV